MSSQILITGATGFIGRQLAYDLVACGERVRILARSPRKAEELFGDTVEVSAGDVCDPDSLAAACRGIKVVYHIAGIYRFGLRHRRMLWEANVEGTENLLQAAASARVDKMVHLSSGGVLKKEGLSDPAAILDENDYPTQASRLCAYKSSKWHSEQRVLAWVKKGLPVAIASTTCPIGRGDETPTPTGRIVRDFLRRQFPCYCRTGLNFIGVGDLSRGLQRVAAAGRSGERYLLSDENLWLKEFLDLLAQKTGIPAPRICLPNGVIRLIGLGGDMFDFLNPRSTGARVCMETALQADRVQFFNNAKARKELGWKPARTMQENIEEAVEWFRAELEVERMPVVAASAGSQVP